MSRVRQSQRWPKCTHRDEIWICSELLILISLDRYKAIPRLLCFRKSSIISKHRIILVSLRFSTFTGLVHLRLFSTSQPLEVRRKVCAKSGVMSSSSSGGLLCSSLVSAGIELLSDLYNFPDAQTNPKRTCKIVDFAVPADHSKIESEKKDKYLDLSRELKKLWNMKVTFILIVFGALGTVTKGLIKGLEELEIRGRVETIQTTALLRSARILGRVLETWEDLLSLKLQWKIIRWRWCEKLSKSK